MMMTQEKKKSPMTYITYHAREGFPRNLRRVGRSRISGASRFQIRVGVKLDRRFERSR